MAALLPPERLLFLPLKARGFKSVHVETDGGTVHALAAPGRGPLPTIVLLHGLSSAAVHLSPLLEPLRKHARAVIALDLPGHGDSEVPADGLTPESLERGMIQALDAIAPGECVVFGNSLGGAAALRFTMARGERVRGLVLVSPAGAPMSERQFETFRKSVAIDSRQSAKDFVDRVFVRPPWPRSMLAWGTQQKFAAPSVRSLLSSTRAEHQFSAHEVRSVRAPTLLVWPKGDRVFPAGCREFFATHLRGATVIEPEGVGHSPYLEDAEGLLQTMVPWMHASVSPSSDATSAAPSRDLARP
ncbi:MAG: alpha/beta hydrolase [Myxococcales bacterium]|nr:alpha/beta hydrolase [Myxococcales bacterium]